MNRKATWLLVALSAGTGLLAMLLAFIQPARAAPGDILVDRATGVDQVNCGNGVNPPCYSIKYAVENVAATGDSVLVAAGTYTEPFTMQPGVVILSQSGPDVTIIDGEGVRGPMVSAASQTVTSTARLEGFTITGGNDRGVNIERASPVISNCTIYDNYGDYGGGIAISQDPANVLISHSRIVSNTASGDGGGIWTDNNAALTLVHSTVASNTAQLWAGGVLGNGGATLMISDTLFQNNHGSYGGGLLAAYTDLTLLNNEFYSNIADAGGAGIHVRDGSTFEIRDNTIEHNEAQGGGGIEIDGGAGGAGNGVIVSNTIRYNRATTHSGGGIAMHDSTAVISGNLIISNTAEMSGGGLYLSGHTGTVAQNIIQDNVAGDSGAGILARGNSRLTIAHNDISGNEAGDNGGGISIEEGPDLLVHHNWIANNTGDGVLVWEATGTIENNLVIHNTLRESEAQIKALGNTTFTVTNNTLVGDGHRAGIRIEDSTTVTVTNNIVIGNEYGIRATGLATLTLDHNDVWDNSLANHQGIAPGTTDISCDPDFVDVASDDYHLGICSCAVDAGTNADTPADDYDGNTRPVDGDGYGTAIVDIGAYERLTVTAPLPKAGFTYTINGLTANFTNTSEHAVSYEWDFGDGVGTSAATHPAYTYGEPGSYTVTLKALCAYGCSDVYQAIVEAKQHEIYLPLILAANDVAPAPEKTTAPAPATTAFVLPIGLLAIGGSGLVLIRRPRR